MIRSCTFKRCLSCKHLVDRMLDWGDGCRPAAPNLQVKETIRTYCVQLHCA